MPILLNKLTEGERRGDAAAGWITSGKELEMAGGVGVGEGGSDNCAKSVRRTGQKELKRPKLLVQVEQNEKPSIKAITEITSKGVKNKRAKQHDDLLILIFSDRYSSKRRNDMKNGIVLNTTL